MRSRRAKQADITKLEKRIFELEQLFGIDLRKRSRYSLSVSIRCYLFKEYEKLGCLVLSEIFDITHASVIHSLKKYHKYKKDEYFKSVILAIEKGDPKLLVPRRIRVYKKVESKRKPIEFKKKEPVKEFDIQMPRQSEVIAVLRKYPTHYLWNLDLQNWKQKDLSNFKLLLD